MSIARKVLSNTAVQVIGKVITALLGIVSVKIVTNYLSATAYGEYAIIYDYTAIFAIIADFGLFTIAVREMAHDEKKVPYILGNVLAVRTLTGILGLGLGVLVAFFIPAYHGTHVPAGIAIVAISTLLALLGGTVSSVLQIHLKMQWASLALVAGKLVTVIYIAATIFYFYPNNPEAGFPHLQFAWVIGTFLALVLTYIPSRKLAEIKYRFDWEFWKYVLKQALPYSVALLMVTIYFRTGSVVMSFFGEKEAVGIYSVAMRFIEIAVIIPAIFMNSILPILTRTIKSDGNAGRVLQYAFDFMALAALPMLAGGVVLAKPIIAFISNDRFLSRPGLFGSDVVLSILLVGMLFTFFHNIFGFSLIALGRQQVLLRMNTVAAIFNVSLNAFLIPFLAPLRLIPIGVSLVAVATELIIFGWGIILIFRFLKFRPKIIFALKTLIASGLMAGVVWFLDPRLRAVMELKSLFLLIPLGGLFYFATLVFLKAFTPEMIEELFKKKEEKAGDEPESIPEIGGI